MKERGLTPKQARFVDEYLKDLNATQAAIRAGYSVKTAGQVGNENIKKPQIQAAIRIGQQVIAEETETEAEWIRRRLKEEADDRTEFATHAGRIRALELLGKINGVFEIDNRQKSDPLAEALRSVVGSVLGPVPRIIEHDDEDE